MTKLALNKRQASNMFLFIGGILLLVAMYLLIGMLNFERRAVSVDATIADVRHEQVQSGKRTIMAYIPVIVIQSPEGRPVIVGVETYNEEPVYRVGDRIDVLCDVTQPRCIPSTFRKRWGDVAIAFGIALALLAVPLTDRWITKHNDVPDTPLRSRRDN